MSAPVRILFIDADAAAHRNVGPLLSSRGFDVEVSMSGAVALKIVASRRPDLILMDLELPDGDGVDICRRIRDRLAVPIIVLSARSAEIEKVRALDAGADDYIVKPFGSEELLARIRVALRHVFASDTPAGRVEHAGLTIDYDLHRVSCDGRPVHLSPKEYELLTLLSRSEGRVLTHRAILRALWGPHAIDRTEHLWTLVRHLRRKIEPNPDAPVYLLTEYGVGYRFGHA